MSVSGLIVVRGRPGRAKTLQQLVQALLSALPCTQDWLSKQAAHGEYASLIRVAKQVQQPLQCQE